MENLTKLDGARERGVFLQFNIFKCSLTISQGEYKDQGGNWWLKGVPQIKTNFFTEHIWLSEQEYPIEEQSNLERIKPPEMGYSTVLLFHWTFVMLLNGGDELTGLGPAPLQSSANKVYCKNSSVYFEAALPLSSRESGVEWGM